MPRGGSEITRERAAELRQAKAEHRAARKAKKQSRKRACKHLGKKIGGADAYGPRGVDCCALSACAIFGKCSVKRKLPGIAFCKDCGKYEAKPKKTAIARGEGKS